MKSNTFNRGKIDNSFFLIAHCVNKRSELRFYFKLRIAAQILGGLARFSEKGEGYYKLFLYGILSIKIGDTTLNYDDQNLINPKTSGAYSEVLQSKFHAVSCQLVIY